MDRVEPVPVRRFEALRGRSGPAALVVVSLALLLAATTAMAQGSAAERPVYSIGEQWLLKDGVYELTKIDKDRYVWAASPGRQIHLGKDLALVAVLKDRIWEWDLTPVPAISWPLEPGKWGLQHRVTLRMRSQPSGIPVRLSWKVNAAEDVPVVGGLFRAFPIAYTANLDAGDPFRGGLQVPGAQSWQVTAWYAPDVRRIVKIQSSSIPALNTEVISLDRPPVAATPAAPPVAVPAPPPAAPPAAAPVPPVAAPAPPPATPPAAAPVPPAAAPAINALAIQWTHPEERARLTDESTVAAAVATSSKGVTEVSILVNGAQVFEERERPSKRSVAIAAPIKLREGTNTIVIRATAADGSVQQEVRSVTFERPAPVNGPTPARLEASRERWAVVIGVGRYASPDIPALRFSVADAEAFARFLVERAGFKKDNVLLLTDTTARKPTLRDMKWALGTFLARSAKKEDLVFMFFAGHGAPEIDPRGAEPDGLAKYLVPIDADPNDLYATALPMDELSIIFDRIEAERVVVFLDACYSGAAGGRTFSSKRTRALRVDDVFLDRLARSRGRAIVTASRASEVSIELPELGHGLFTHYLLQGLRGAADLDRDGVVSLAELYTYLEQQVAQKSRSVGGNQHPVMKGDMEGVLPLTKMEGR